MSPPMKSMEHADHRCYERGCRRDECRKAYSAHIRIRRRERATRNINGVAPAWFVHGADCYRNHRCRCEVCVEGNRADMRAARARRFAARQLIDGRLVAVDASRHGASTTYTNHGCRCGPCTTAATRDRWQRFTQSRSDRAAS